MSRARTAIVVVGVAIVLAYGGAIGLLAYHETSLVFVSAGDGKRGRPVPEDAPIPWDTLRVPDLKGTPVFLLRSLQDQPRNHPWVIFFHGNAGFVGSRSSVERYALLREAGFNVLAVEYRGYGVSRGVGEPSEEGIQLDARAALHYLTGWLGVPPRRIAGYGWSLGSGPAAQLVADAGLGALVTEGAFTSLPDVGASLYPWIPVRLMMRNRFDNLDAARRLRAPWLLLHGTRDTEIPFRHAERLAAVSSTERLVALDADHGDGVTADRRQALAALRQLARSLGSDGP